MIAAIRGTQDILPGIVDRWQFVESTACRVFEQYGYGEIRTPIIEREELFAKGTGETTDIVQKEMYAFTDKDGERITLRPEATPSLVRAFVEHSLEQGMAVPKIYTIGPMFRRERPQKGRYRQFHQLDVEVFGVKDPSVDGEVIDLAWTLVRELGINDVELAVNSVGCQACRPAFAAALVAALGDDVKRLCADCQRRAVTNPLRIFDCKVPADQPVIDALPHTIDYLCDECRAHYGLLQRVLNVVDTLPVPVRGEEYGGEVWRRIESRLPSRPDRVGIGFAAGIERLVLALPETLALAEKQPDVFIAALGDPARDASLALLRDLRRAGLNAQVEYEGRSLKSQMKRADRLKAPLVFILGDDELARGEVTVRRMASSSQESIPLGDAVAFVRASR